MSSNWEQNNMSIALRQTGTPNSATAHLDPARTHSISTA